MTKSLLLKTLTLALALLGTTVTAQPLEKGKEAYVKNGCWACHGMVGQGGIAGTKLAPDPKPYEFMDVFIRHTKGPMPRYSEKILSPQELKDIHLYLQSIPKGPDYKSIELLNLN